MEPSELRVEELNGEIVVLETGANLVHRIVGETAEAVRAEADPVSRRRMIQTLIAGGVAVGVTTLVLPSAAAAASGGGGEPALGSSYGGGVGDMGVTAPTGVNATAGNAEVTVSWLPVDGATKYRVYVSDDGGSTYLLAWAGSATTTTVTSLTNGTEYQFIVVTVSGTATSNSSAPATATPVLPLLPAVAWDGLSIYVSGEVWQYWDAPGGAIEPDYYEVQYRLVGDSWSSSLETSDTNMLFTNLSRRTTYEFRVRYFASPQYSEWSSIRTVTTN